MQLGLLTDMQFSCPTGMTGSYARGKRLVLCKYMYLTVRITWAIKDYMAIAHC